jgi:apolipoprotein N-acyltransferase
MTDPYAPQAVPFYLKFPALTAALVVGLVTALLTAVMFPPFHAPEFAYAFAAPAVLWAYRRPSFKLYASTLVIAQSVAWFVILIWLRHVTLFGTILLAPIVGIWVGVWYAAVWWAMPRMVGQVTVNRLLIQLGLAGAWVVIEWTRTWFLSGFPWLPLAASQWERNAVLQIAAYTGAYGVSFVLIVMNIGFAAYAHRLFFETKQGFSRRSQEFMLALFLLLTCIYTLLGDTFNRGYYAKPLGRIAVIQPDIPQDEKWDDAKAVAILRTLQNLTELAGKTAPDLVLWPESATPFWVSPKNDLQGRSIVESIAKQANAPLLFGTIASAGSSGQGNLRLFDAAEVAMPATGLQPQVYAKRHLVPFGEYVPARFILGWLRKMVPIPEDTTPGTDPTPLLIGLKNGAMAAGPLICYEDVFPDLARASVGAGADALFVLTNDAWYGEEGAAYQHAAHSVLRAIETRRPVIRCGNAGWSGWIDEYGSFGVVDVEHDHVPNIMMKDGSVYYRGFKTISVLRDTRWIGQRSFYVEYGDWFVVASAALALFAYYLARGHPFTAEPAETEIAP